MTLATPDVRPALDHYLEAPPISTPLRVVGSIQGELGIREPAPMDSYGPTSALSEELLWHGYRNASIEPEEAS